MQVGDIELEFLGDRSPTDCGLFEQTDFTGAVIVVTETTKRKRLSHYIPRRLSTYFSPSSLSGPTNRTNRISPASREEGDVTTKATPLLGETSSSSYPDFPRFATEESLDLLSIKTVMSGEQEGGGGLPSSLLNNSNAKYVSDANKKNGGQGLQKIGIGGGPLTMGHSNPLVSQQRTSGILATSSSSPGSLEYEATLPRFNVTKLTINVGDAILFRWFSWNNLVERMGSLDGDVKLPHYDAEDTMPLQFHPTRNKKIFDHEEDDDFNTKGTLGGRREPISSGHPCQHGRFFHVFNVPGTYYLSSLLNDTLGVKVVVLSEKAALRKQLLKAGASIALITLTVALAVTVLAYIVRSVPFFSSNQEAYEEKPFRGFKSMRDLFFAQVFPWVAFAVIFFLGFVILQLVLCCTPQKVTEYGRGFASRQRRIIQCCVLLSIPFLLTLAMAMWYFVLYVNFGFVEVFRVMSMSVTGHLNELLYVIENLKFLKDSVPQLIPSFNVPAEATTILAQAEESLVTARSWAEHGEELLRAAFRFVAILVFLGMQVILYGASTAVVGSIRRRADVTRAATRLLVLSVCFVSLTIGTNAIISVVMQRTYDTGMLFQSRQLQRTDMMEATGLSKDDPLMQVMGACLPEGALSVDFLADALKQGVGELNRLLGDTDAIVPGPTTDLTMALLLNYSDYVSSQLVSLDIRMAKNPELFSSIVPEMHANVTPILRTGLSVINSLKGLLDCQIVRATLTDILPVIKTGVLQPLHTSFVIRVFLFIFLLGLITMVMVAARVYDRPYKRWYEPQSNRWFLFRMSFRAHRQVLAARSNQQPQSYSSFSSNALRKSKSNDAGLHKSLSSSSHRKESTSGSSFLKHSLSRWININANNDLWIPPPTSRFSLVRTLHYSNMANSFMLLLQATLLVFLNYSHGVNALPDILRWVTLFCCFAPILNLLATTDKYHFRIHAGLRIMAFALTLSSAVICFVFVRRVTRESQRCMSQLDKLDATPHYPFSQDCSIDKSLRSIENAVYFSVVGFVCLVSSLTTLGLLAFVRLSNLVATDFVFEELSLRRFYSKHKTRRALFVLTTTLLTLAVIVAFIFALVLIFNIKLIPSPGSGFDDKSGSFVMDLSPGTCNGHKSHCPKKINELMWLTTHNSFSSMDLHFVSPNHFFGIETQLAAGVRAFMLDVWEEEKSSPAANTSTNSSSPAPSTPSPSSLLVCHGLCYLGSEKLSTIFSQFQNFLSTNQSQVLIVTMEVYAPHDDILKVLKETQLFSLLWTPLASTSAQPQPIWDSATGFSPGYFTWPTLQELISQNKRLILFTDVRKTKVEKANTEMNGFLYMWDYMFENTYHFENVGDFSKGKQKDGKSGSSVAEDSACRINRGGVGSSTNASVIHYLKQKLSMLNHFVTSPVAAPPFAALANTPASIVQHGSLCQKSWFHQLPNLISIDFWSIGNPLQTVDELSVASSSAP